MLQNNNYIATMWRGDERLWKTFWIIGIALSAWLGITLYFADMKGLPPIWWVGFAPIVIAVHIWWYIALWRCAPNTSRVVWKVLARAFVVLSTLYFFQHTIALFR
jgi:hypothetical protein